MQAQRLEGCEEEQVRVPSKACWTLLFKVTLAEAEAGPLVVEEGGLVKLITQWHLQRHPKAVTSVYAGNSRAAELVEWRCGAQMRGEGVPACWRLQRDRFGGVAAGRTGSRDRHPQSDISRCSTAAGYQSARDGTCQMARYWRILAAVYD